MLPRLHCLSDLRGSNFQSCQRTEQMQTSLELAPGLVSESTLSPRLKRSSDLSVTANMLVAQSPASLNRHGA